MGRVEEGEGEGVCFNRSEVVVCGEERVAAGFVGVGLFQLVGGFSSGEWGGGQEGGRGGCSYALNLGGVGRAGRGGCRGAHELVGGVVEE